MSRKLRVAALGTVLALVALTAGPPFTYLVPHGSPRIMPTDPPPCAQ
jgi:hypothetical protein